MSDLGQFIDAIVDFRSSYFGSTRKDKSGLVFGITDLLRDYPLHFVSALQSKRDQASLEDDPVRLAIYGYCAYLLGKIDEAENIGTLLLHTGQTDLLTIDLVSRCYIAKGKLTEALRLLSEFSDQHFCPLFIGKIASLYYTMNALRQANDTAKRLQEEFLTHAEKQALHIFSLDRQLLIASDASERMQMSETVDWYDDKDSQKSAWREYQNAWKGDGTDNRSHFLNHYYFSHNLILDTIGDFIKKNKVDCIINFGSSYGRIEYDLACRYPNINVIGYDRSEIATKLNEGEFSLRNLQFLSGGISSLKKEISGKNTLLFHIRTCILLYPEELTALYEECYQLGIKNILAVENTNYSQLCGAYPEFRNGLESSSLVIEGIMMAHDYVTTLSDAGYDARLIGRKLQNHHPDRHKVNSYSWVTEVFLGSRR